MRLSSVIAGLSAAAVAFQGVAYAVQGPAKSLLRPPGAQGEADFSARCIKCGKCMEACPYLALSPAPGDAGNRRRDSHGRRARPGLPPVRGLSLRRGVPHERAARHRGARSDVRMGTAVIDEDLCIAFQGMRCEVCYRTCPLIDEAIVDRLPPARGRCHPFLVRPRHRRGAVRGLRPVRRALRGGRAGRGHPHQGPTPSIPAPAPDPSTANPFEERWDRQSEELKGREGGVSWTSQDEHSSRRRPSRWRAPQRRAPCRRCRLRGRRFGLHGRRVGRRGAEVHGRVPFLRLRLRRDLRGEGRQARERDGRPGQRVQQGPQLRQGLLPGQDPLRRRPSDHAAHPRGQGHEGHRRGPARGHVGRGAGPRVRASSRRRGRPTRPAWRSGSSGQQPITEGYACAKFIKAGLLSNNVDPNARLCMASAVVGFMNVFQTDEPAGCYADLDERRRVRHLGRQHGRGAPHAVLAPDGPQALGQGREALRPGHHPHAHVRERRQGACCSSRTPTWPSRTASRTTSCRTRSTTRPS